VQHDAETQAARLLRFLLLRLGSVPADPGEWQGRLRPLDFELSFCASKAGCYPICSVFRLRRALRPVGAISALRADAVPARPGGARCGTALMVRDWPLPLMTFRVPSARSQCVLRRFGRRRLRLPSRQIHLPQRAAREREARFSYEERQLELRRLSGARLH
jgi:hypothetical protein